jgi:hypothetical protein
MIDATKIASTSKVNLTSPSLKSLNNRAAEA